MKLLFRASFCVLLHFHNKILWRLLRGYIKCPHLAPLCAFMIYNKFSHGILKRIFFIQRTTWKVFEFFKSSMCYFTYQVFELFKSLPSLLFFFLFLALGQGSGGFLVLLLLPFSNLPTMNDNLHSKTFNYSTLSSTFFNL